MFDLHTGVFDALNHFGYRSRFDKSVKLLLIDPGNIGGKVIDYISIFLSVSGTIPSGAAVSVALSVSVLLSAAASAFGSSAP